MRQELARAEHGEWQARRDGRAALLTGVAMVLSLLLQLGAAGLAMHLSGPAAQQFYVVALLLGPLPAAVVVAWQARRE